MTASRRGFSMLLGLVMLGGFVATLLAFSMRIDSQTRRITTLKRNVQALFVANEMLESLAQAYGSGGSLPGTGSLERPYGEAAAMIVATSGANRSFLAFVRGNCADAAVVVAATLRRAGAAPGRPARTYIENKMVFYGSHRIEEPTVRQMMLAKLRETYREVRRNMDADRELKRQGLLDQTYRSFLAETGLDEAALAVALENLDG